MAKERINLLIERTALEKGRRYSDLHQTSISRLVTEFLSNLPVEEEKGGDALTPTVRRLLGVAAGGAGEEDYGRYLLEKYGA